MKKILFVNDLICGGGVEKVLYDIVSFLDKNKYDITVFSPSEEKNFYDIYPSCVKHIYYYPSGLLNKNGNSLIIRIIKKFSRIFNSKKLNRFYDTVVAIKEGQSMNLVSQLDNCKKKIGWIHTDYLAFYWTGCVFGSEKNELECMKKFDDIVCVSKAVRDSVIHTIGDPGNLCLRYNPLNIDEIKIKSRQKCDIPKLKSKDELVFVTVGRLAKQKGYTELLNMISQLDNSFNFQLWIIGDGDKNYKIQMEEIIKKNCLESKVFMLGKQDNPYPYIKAADWFVCSSQTESFGLAIQEALILGVPVVTTGCPGACELLDDKYSIITDRVEDMKDIFVDILNNPTKTQHYRQNAEGYYKPVSAIERLKAIEELF